MITKNFKISVDTNSTRSLSVKITNRSPEENCLIEFDVMSYYISISSPEEMIKFGQEITKLGQEIVQSRSSETVDRNDSFLSNDPVDW